MKYNPAQTNTMPKIEKVKNIFWHYVNITVFKYTPSHFFIFRLWRVFLVRLFGGQIDWTASLHPNAKIDYPWNLSIGEKSSIGDKCWVYALNNIEIGKYTCIGKDVYLLTGSHDIQSKTFDLVTKPIKIKDGCWVATSSIVLPGIIIGEFSVVAASSVVVKDIEPFSVVGGNPAKYLKERVIKE